MINKDIIKLITIIELILAPTQIIINGPSATLGNEFKIVKNGSITFLKKEFHQRSVAIIKPNTSDISELIIIWVGASINSIIVMSLMISLFITIINLYNYFINTNENYITLLKSMKATKLDIYKKIILKANQKNIINTIKINISMSFIGLLPLVGEKIFFNKCYSRY